MSDNLDRQCYGKKRKLSHIQPNANQNEVDESLNIKLSSGIFKMDIDCFEELFEFLSMVDLLNLRTICKRFKKLVSFYIRNNCPGFGKFQLNEQSFDVFRQMDADTIRMVKELSVSVTQDFDATQFSTIEKLLENVRKVTITEWKTDPNFYDTFLKYCKNVE